MRFDEYGFVNFFAFSVAITLIAMVLGLGSGIIIKIVMWILGINLH